MAKGWNLRKGFGMSQAFFNGAVANVALAGIKELIEENGQLKKRLEVLETV